MPTQHRDFAGLTDWVPIFRAGRQTDSKGRAANYTQADLDQIVANHDPEHPAPHVITHKELYSPFAYGKAVALKREGDTLFARSQDIEPQFESLVKDGRLYERSVRLVPTDNGYKLGHIAWLGAEPPAVGGLAPVQFSKGDTLDIDFSDDGYTPSVLARTLRRLREFLVDKFSTEDADRVLPDYDIEALSAHAETVRREQEPATEFSQQRSTHTPTPAGGAAVSQFTQADIDAAKKAARDEAAAEFSQRESALNQQLSTERLARRHAEFQAEVDAAIDAGRLTPAMATGLVEFMLSLGDGEDVAFEFSQGEGDQAKTVKRAPLDWFRDFIQAVPPAGPATGETDAGAELRADAAHQFQAPAGAHVDAERLKIHERALEYQANHQGVDYLSAVRFVENQEG